MSMAALQTINHVRTFLRPQKEESLAGHLRNAHVPGIIELEGVRGNILGLCVPPSFGQQPQSCQMPCNLGA